MPNYMEKVRAELKSVLFYRDLIAEFLGTFMLVSIQAALPLTWGNTTGNIGTAVQVALGMGFIVTTMAETFGPLSGGHFNPAVSFSMVVGFKITFTRGLFYILVQSVAGICGAGFVYGVTPAMFRGTLAATVPNPQLLSVQALFIEAWLTSILVFTILGSTNEKRKTVFMPTIAIGMAVALDIMAGFASTGASMNPARSLGPAVFTGLWRDHWIYWLGPFLGGAFATAVYSGLLENFDRFQRKDIDIQTSNTQEMNGKQSQTISHEF